MNGNWNKEKTQFAKEKFTCRNFIIMRMISCEGESFD